MKYKELTKKIVSEESFAKLIKYVKLIEEKNKVMNLTGFSGDRLWQEGIYESIFVLIKGFGSISNKKILDIGAGAGFPSVPYLIAFPQNKLTIYEPQRKRAIFLEEVKRELDLDINIENVRVEEVEVEEEFDFITARAVASFKILAEISHKVAKLGATFAFFKGPKAMEEIHEARFIIKKLEINPKSISIETEGRKNNLIKYIKQDKTPKNIPRPWRDIVRKK